MLDEAAARLVDEASGERDCGGPQSGKVYRNQPAGAVNCYGDGWEQEQVRGYTDSGGASRFFYVAKADKADRGRGNTHPTVKPTALMRWLVRLACPPGGTVLDPFLGSGSTAVAALAEGCSVVGIEREQTYFDTARQRAGRAAAEARCDLFAAAPAPPAGRPGLWDSCEGG